MVSGFPPHENNIELGGVGVKIDLHRSGRYKEAKQDSYRRQYNKDYIKYTYQKNESNKIRIKGRLVFKTLEITGSKDMIDDVAKYSMLMYHIERFSPILLEMRKKMG